MSFDIGSTPDVVTLEEQGVRIELRDAAGEPWMVDGSPVTALVAGVYSRRYAKAKTRTLDRAMKASGGRSAEKIEAAQVLLDAALVIEWDITSGGVSADPASIFVSHPFLREQVTEAANDHARFFTTASPTR